MATARRYKRFARAQTERTGANVGSYVDCGRYKNTNYAYRVRTSNAASKSA